MFCIDSTQLALFSYVVGSVLATAMGVPVFNPPLQNFTQRVQHGSSNNETFLQQYQLNTAFFRPGGPILFHQSEEGAISPINYHVFADYAEELGAAMTTLER
jgi:hypothetical protein